MSKHSTSGFKSVLTAVVGNAFVALLKFIGWLMTGSSVMLSEGIHSIADTANQALLFIGIKRSQRPADDNYQYGYRQERFFWALISACGIFFVGAGVTFVHGIYSLIEKEISHPNIWTFVILGCSFVLEGFALATAYGEAKKYAGDEPVLKHLKHSGDPTIMAVLYEDSAALIGIIIALLSIILANATGNPIWDGIGSILVSLLLASISVLLIYTNRGYILNKSVPWYMKEKIKEALLAEGLIDEIFDLKTTMIGVDGYIIKVEIEVNGYYLAKKIFESTDMHCEYDEIENYNDFIKYSSKLCDQTTRTMGREIDEIERRMIEKFPKIKHIDLETN